MPTTFLPPFRDWWHDRVLRFPMIDTFLQPVKHSRGGWTPPRFPGVFLNPARHQQLPQHIGKPRGWPLRPSPFDDIVHSSPDVGELAEWRAPSYNLPEGRSSISVGRGTNLPRGLSFRSHTYLCSWMGVVSVTRL